MTINYNCTGADRKKLVASISEITGADSKYLGAPTFAYQVDYFTIDRNGGVTFDDRADSEEIENLLEKLDAAGFHAEPVTDGGDKPAPTEVTTEENLQTADEEPDSLVVSLPLDGFTESSLDNLRRLVDSKQGLIKKALGAENLPIEVTQERVSFPWFSGNFDPDTTQAYIQFIVSLCAMAKEAKRVTATEKPTDNEKYAFRCFLLRLGFIGNEYKAHRKILLKNLTGSSAFKAGARKEAATDAVSE
jgi:hypothetical protein